MPLPHAFSTDSTFASACRARDGSYWALQAWQQALPNYGLAATPAQSVWIVTPTSKRGELHPDAQRIVDALAQHRARLDLFQAPGAAAYLFGVSLEDVAAR